VAGLQESVKPLCDRGANNMLGDLELRRRRAAYRANHRGTKEMDWLLGRYADEHLAGMDADALARFERLLAIPDPDLQQWILKPDTLGDTEFARPIAALRRFHKLELTTGDASTCQP
jgi:antitoxin CptB